MSKHEMETIVANLLLKQRRFKRLGTDLPPNELALLSRLLQRLGYTKMQRVKSSIQYARLTLSKPRPAVSFNNEPINEHDLHDENGNIVGNVKLRDRGPILHIDWIGGKGKFANANRLGREAMRSVHDALANHYPRAQYLRGHRISGFRGDEIVGTPVMIPIRRRNVKMSRKNKPIVKRYMRDAWWMEPNGELHPLGPGEDHASFANERLGNVNNAWKQGWQRIVKEPKQIWAHNPHTPPTSKQRSALKDLAIIHKVDGVTHEGPTGERQIVRLQRKNKSIVKKYAKFNRDYPVSPLVHGFPIEHALRHIANHPESTEDAKNLAVAALKGHTESLWGLHDELQNSNHPILKAGYKWLNAADKLHLDKHTHTALNEEAENVRRAEPDVEHRVHANQYIWRYTPEHRAMQAVSGLSTASSNDQRDLANRVINRVKELSPHSSDENIHESIRRHAHRALMESSRRNIGTSPDDLDSISKNSINEPKNDNRSNYHIRNEIATRYSKKNNQPRKYSLANKSKEYSKYTKSINYTRYGDPEQSAWWMDPKGNMHELDDDTDDHAGWIKRHGELVKDDGSGDGVLTRAFKSGWTRLYKMKDTLHVNNPKKILSQPQLWSLKDHALINKIKQLYIYGPPGTKQQIRLSRPKRYSLANKSNFIGALLKASSPEHRMFVKRTEELAKRIGASKTKQFPALHDTPTQSVPGVALAVYGNIQPNAAHALGSWINGLLPNGTGYVVFHAKLGGPDTLYRLRMEGSGYDIRSKLDRIGIGSRVFVPHKKGLDILILDKGNTIGQLIEQFAKEQKIPIEASQGYITTVGSQNQGQARDIFRNKIAKHESNMNNQQVYNRRKLVKRYAEVKVDKPSPFKNSPSQPSTTPVKGSHKKWLESHGMVSDEKENDKVDLAPSKKPISTGDTQKFKYPPAQKTISKKPLFSKEELNRLDQWAHSQSRKNHKAFSEFLGLSPRHLESYKFLHRALLHAATHAKRGQTSVKIAIGKTGKKLKINVGNRTPWNDKLHNPKTVPIPKGTEAASRLTNQELKNLKKKPIKKQEGEIDNEMGNEREMMSRYSRRRHLLKSMYSINLN